jgi:hypothetical protein
MKQTINLRQMGCLAGILIFANKILVLPSLFYDKVGVDGWFILLFYFTIDLLLLAVFFKVKTIFKKETFFEVLSKFLTKYGAYFVYILIAFFFIMRMVATFNISLMYLKNQVYFEEGSTIFVICFLVVANSLVFKGLRSTCRTIEFFYPVILLLAFICIFSTITNFNDLPLFFNNSIGVMAENSFNFLFWFGDTLFFFLIMDKIEFKKEKVKTVYITVIINMVIIALLHLTFYSVFKYTGFMHNNAASDVLTFSNKFVGLGRIDILAVFVVMILVYFQLTIFNMSFDASLSALIPKENKLYSVVIFDLLFLSVLYLWITDFTKAINLSFTIMPFFTLLLEYLLPILCLIYGVIRIRGKNEKVH